MVVQHGICERPVSVPPLQLAQFEFHFLEPLHVRRIHRSGFRLSFVINRIGDSVFSTTSYDRLAAHRLFQYRDDLCFAKSGLCQRNSWLSICHKVLESDSSLFKRSLLQRPMRGIRSRDDAPRVGHVHGIIQNLFRVGRH